MPEAVCNMYGKRMGMIMANAVFEVHHPKPVVAKV
jgi:hypothetical protein